MGSVDLRDADAVCGAKAWHLGTDASFAGQFHSELGVLGAADVAEAVERCATGVGSDRVVAYAARTGSPLPQVVPDTVRVATDGTVATRLGEKAVRVDIAPDGPAQTSVADDERGRACLSDDTARVLADLGRHCEELLGRPVDVEWAVADGEVWLLQARPMTALPASGVSAAGAGATPTNPVGPTGTASSPGVATGPVRVVRDVDGFSEVQRGDVLLCRSTDPAWTPLFGIVSAVVTETGGMLSHASIVAREVGIPAVVGAAGALDAFADGTLVTVDGDRGLVTPVEDAG